ncbi:GTP-binding protein [Thraustotheca clavata]|uniref:Elongation factor Tu, chloroplastic n=1 Tax=Thraustotheca clavata TaxID=74557 RepID=A0A1V9ZQ34_9STRA|nr:GTP-binding protein [Thraustotheca clavata]
MAALPAEIEQGNVEYKVQLLRPSRERLQHLVTQLNWRLNEGRGEAYYELGVADDGKIVGMAPEDLEMSLATLLRMCQVLGADMKLVTLRNGSQPTWKAARVAITRIADTHGKKQVRVSVIGDVDCGKSTLIGVLTRGCLDDGNGLARMQVFRHLHEIENGRTSSISEQILGVTKDGKICKFNTMESRNTSSIDAQSHKLIMFSDLAGHERYLKITATGLASQFPDYAMLVVDATKGVQKMTKEHLLIVLGLGIAVFVVITKSDLVDATRIQTTLSDVQSLLESAVMVDNDQPYSLANILSCVPIFTVSAVTGESLLILQSFFASVMPTRLWGSLHDCTAEFFLSGYYDTDAGSIVAGLVKSGTVHVGDSLLLGPTNSGAFYGVHVKSIEVQRTPAKSIYAGQTGALLLSSLDNSTIDFSMMRKGMMLVHPSLRPIATRQFDAEVQLVDSSVVLKENVQGVIHAGPIQQTAKIVHVQYDNDICRLRFEFVHCSEYLRPDLPLVFRARRTQAVGKVLHAVHTVKSVA